MFSVVASVWNRPSALKQFLNCISNQTIKPKQIIIVDDSSSAENMLAHRKITLAYNAEYLYVGVHPKKFRRAACMRSGLFRVTTDITASMGVDHIFPSDYFEKCLSIMTKYTNIVLFHRCENITVKQATSMVSENRFPEGKTYPVHSYYTGEETFWSTISNVHAAINGTGCDGCFFIRTEQAVKFDIWDANIVSWGGEHSDLIRTCLLNEMCPVAVWDIVTYHTGHPKVDEMYLLDSDYQQQYLLDKWTEVPIPATVDLVKIENTLENLGMK